MRLALLFLLAAGVAGADPAAKALPRGDERFRLGMSRAAVESLITARGVEMISNGGTFLVCASKDPRVEYEQYSFYIPGRGISVLWKVSIGYRLTASQEDFAAVRADLSWELGEPQSEAVDRPSPDGYGNARPVTSAQVAWADPHTAVQLGGRWVGSTDPVADRMLVTWTDRKVQRLADVRRKKAREAADESN
ncbi:MAG TPA: hypothetical protein VJY35_04505 [Candidatus Eisenbacteria bacterium]|nr:hypothetical protein [Candidatus Eisenbacteria bacterium]